MRSLASAARQRARTAETLDRLASAVRDLHVESAERLEALAGRTRDGVFRVVIIGSFSSGKTTLVNALLGRRVLPEKINPCTAVLTEVVYGDAPGVTLHHHDGQRVVTDLATFTQTFQLQTADGDDNDAFRDVARAVITWPLPLLRDGVVLVDTPGLDDDPARTARTLATLPRADAVLVVLNATRFLTSLERQVLQDGVMPLGLRTLFFPVAMNDLLEVMTPDADATRARLTDRLTSELPSLSPSDNRRRDESAPPPRVFFVNGRGARMARAAEPEDADGLTRSGLPPLERSLTDFLLHERAADRAANTLAAATAVRRTVQALADVDARTAALSVAEITARADELAPQLAEVEAIAARVARITHDYVRDEATRTWQDLRRALARTERDLPKAIAQAQAGRLAGLRLLTPGGRALVAERLEASLQGWLDARLTAWRATLTPRLAASISALRAEVSAEGDRYDVLTDALLASFTAGDVQLPRHASPDGARPGTSERWASAALGVALVSPGAVAAGWTQGYGGALRGAAGRISARLGVVALGAVLGPPGWVGLALYAASDGAVLVATGGAELRHLRAELATALSGRLIAAADDARDTIEAEVRAALAPVADAIVSAATEDAHELRHLIEATVHARATTRQSAVERASAWANALTVIDQGLGDLALLP